MAAGGPGDHWQTDLLTFGIAAFGEPVDPLIRDIMQLGGHRLLDDHSPLGRRLGALWASSFSSMPIEFPKNLESELRDVRDVLSREAAERGWDLPSIADRFER